MPGRPKDDMDLLLHVVVRVVAPEPPKKLEKDPGKALDYNLREETRIQNKSQKALRKGTVKPEILYLPQELGAAKRRLVYATGGIGDQGVKEIECDKIDFGAFEDRKLSEIQAHGVVIKRHKEGSYEIGEKVWFCKASQDGSAVAILANLSIGVIVSDGLINDVVWRPDWESRDGDEVLCVVYEDNSNNNSNKYVTAISWRLKSDLPAEIKAFNRTDLIKKYENLDENNKWRDELFYTQLCKKSQKLWNVYQEVRRADFQVWPLCRLAFPPKRPTRSSMCPSLSGDDPLFNVKGEPYEGCTDVEELWRAAKASPRKPANCNLGPDCPTNEPGVYLCNALPSCKDPFPQHWHVPKDKCPIVGDHLHCAYESKQCLDLPPEKRNCLINNPKSLHSCCWDLTTEHANRYTTSIEATKKLWDDTKAIERKSKVPVKQVSSNVTGKSRKGLKSTGEAIPSEASTSQGPNNSGKRKRQATKGTAKTGETKVAKTNQAVKSKSRAYGSVPPRSLAPKPPGFGTDGISLTVGTSSAPAADSSRKNPAPGGNVACPASINDADSGTASGVGVVIHEEEEDVDLNHIPGWKTTTSPGTPESVMSEDDTLTDAADKVVELVVDLNLGSTATSAQKTTASQDSPANGASVTVDAASPTEDEHSPETVAPSSCDKELEPQDTPILESSVAVSRVVEANAMDTPAIGVSVMPQMQPNLPQNDSFMEALAVIEPGQFVDPNYAPVMTMSPPEMLSSPHQYNTIMGLAPVQAELVPYAIPGSTPPHSYANVQYTQAWDPKVHPPPHPDFLVDAMPGMDMSSLGTTDQDVCMLDLSADPGTPPLQYSNLPAEQGVPMGWAHSVPGTFMLPPSQPAGVGGHVTNAAPALPVVQYHDFDYPYYQSAGMKANPDSTGAHQMDYTMPAPVSSPPPSLWPTIVNHEYNGWPTYTHPEMQAGAEFMGYMNHMGNM